MLRCFEIVGKEEKERERRQERKEMKKKIEEVNHD